ncbi:MAG: CopG family ribbon-helix-helix protein [Candidatus Methanoplasma sp.]|jgi:CopG family nickel-responsive transcriptional regulator|nr:CopG family ribbon-helix-helix protein [Candidatus Methanoplasma sp.]
MAIISVSLDDESLAALDDIKATYGLGGRSEAVRRAICAARAEAQDLTDMEGDVEGVLVVIKKDHADPWMSLIQAKHEKDIKTQLHSHLKDHKCLEVMVISSRAEDLAEMIRAIHSEGKAEYVRLVRG